MRRRTALALLAAGAVAPACARSRPDRRLRVPLASVPEATIPVSVSGGFALVGER